MQLTTGSLNPLRLGTIVIRNPVIQAALSGYSDAPMRRIARKFGCEFALCEVMLDQFVVAVSKRKSRLYFAESDEHPIGAQLMGSEPVQFVRAAQRLVQLRSRNALLAPGSRTGNPDAWVHHSFRLDSRLAGMTNCLFALNSQLNIDAPPCLAKI